MPPKIQSTQLIHNQNHVDDQIGDLNKRKEQIDCFMKHCQRFYEHSLSSISDNSNLYGSENSGQVYDTCTSQKVMNAFNDMLSGQRNVSVENSAMVQCGFNSITDKELLEFSKVRDDIRRRAHEKGMKERRNMFLEILNENNSSSVLDRKDNPENIYAGYETCVKDFASNYKKNIGIHPLLAGVRHLLQSQINHIDRIVIWKFYSTSITEAIDTNNSTSMTENSDNSFIFMSESVVMLHSFLVRAIEEEEKETIDVSYEEIVSCWKVKKSLNKRKMKRLLSFLPKMKELHAKPTGEILVTNIVRVSENTKMDWCCSSFFLS